MRAVLFTQYFPPEVGATQTRLDVFARHLAESGHDVTVVAEVPNHPIGRIFDGWRGRPVVRTREHGYDVIRVWVATSPRKSFWRRIAFYASYCINATIAALVLHRRRPDVVFASSPPLPVLLSAVVCSAVWRRPLVVDIRDIWPAIGIALGELPPGRAADAARLLERAIYRRASAISCVTRSFVRHVEALVDDPAKVHYLPNGTIPTLFDPDRGDPGLRDRLGLGRSFVVGYVGLHGIAQGLGAVVEAAALLRDRDVKLLMVGEGPEKPDLEATVRSRRLDNVVFHPQVPLQDAAAFINACDVVVVPLRRLELLSSFVPSKVFDVMACGRPVILSVDGEARAIVEEAGAGVYVEAENAEALAAVVEQLRADPERRAAMGAAGRRCAVEHYDRAVQAVRLEQILATLVGAASVRQ